MEKEDLAGVMVEEEEVMVVEAAAVMVEAGAMVVEVREVMEGEEEAEEEDMEGEAVTGETDRPNAIAALPRLRKARRSMLLLIQLGDVGMASPVSTIS